MLAQLQTAFLFTTRWNIALVFAQAVSTNLETLPFDSRIRSLLLCTSKQWRLRAVPQDIQTLPSVPYLCRWFSGSKHRHGAPSNSLASTAACTSEAARAQRLPASLFLLSTMLAGACSFVAMGQTTTGSIFGTVQDQNGNFIPNAQVTSTDVHTRIAHTVQTNGSGNYVFPSVPPGDYSIATQVAGFGQQTQSGVHVDANQNAQASFTLTVGSQSQDITVTSAAPLIDTRESQLGTTIDIKRIEELPLNGRDVSSLVQLVPGVTAYSAAGPGGNQYGTTFSVNGAHTNEDSFYLDGAFDSALFITGGNLLPNPDALQEFRLLTTNFNAGFGRYPGGVVNVITRSGTNSFHGLAYDYLRNNALNSRNYFNSTITPLKQNQFGGNLGGPIIRDKAFFFVSYEGLRIVTPTIIAANSLVLPTPAEAGGDFSALNPSQYPMVNGVPYSYNGRAGVINPALLDPVAQNFLKLIPLANPTTGLAAQQSASANTSANQGLVHIDYQPTQNHQISGMFFSHSPTTIIRARAGISC